MACLEQEGGIADTISSATALVSSSWMSDQEGAPAAAQAPPLARLSNQELLSELLARCREYDGAAWTAQGNVPAAELVEGAKTASRLCLGMVVGSQYREQVSEAVWPVSGQSGTMQTPSQRALQPQRASQQRCCTRRACWELPTPFPPCRCLPGTASCVGAAQTTRTSWRRPRGPVW